MGEPSIDSLHDPYEDQLSAARYKAERDQLRQELKAMRERNIELWMESGMMNELVTCAEQKAERLGKLVWRLQNRLAKAHRRERNLRKGMREWREKVISAPVRTMSAYDLLPEEDLQALRWVREQGGLEEVRKRIMPEGYEWPRYESGEVVGFGDKGLDVHGRTLTVEGVQFTQSGLTFIEDDMGCAWWGSDSGPMEDAEADPDKRVKRPDFQKSPKVDVPLSSHSAAPKVLDADGVEIRVGDVVYGTKDMRYQVTELCEHEPSIVHAKAIDGNECGEEFIADNPRINSFQLKADKLTHRATVLAGGGRYAYASIGLGSGKGQYRLEMNDSEERSLSLRIKYCPMCGRRLKGNDTHR